MLWLASRERWQAVALWTFTLIPIAAIVATLASDHPDLIWYLGSRVMGLFTLLLYLGVASQAGRFFVDARRSGLMDSILGTPLTPQEIVGGQWRGIVRKFAAPLLLWMAVLCVGALLEHRAWRGITIGATATRAGTNAPPTPAPATQPAVVTTADTIESWIPIVTAFGKGLTVIANMIALVWFGMWMGLNSKSGNLSTLKTLLFVQILPWFVITFVSFMGIPLFLLLPQVRSGGASTQFFGWFPLLISGTASTLFLLKDLGFVLWSRKKLYSEFRERALAVTPHRVVLPPPLPVGPLIANKFE